MRKTHRKKRKGETRTLEIKEQAYLRRVNRAIFKANNGCLRPAKQIMMGSKQATPGEETTTVIQARLPRDDMLEEERREGERVD